MIEITRLTEATDDAVRDINELLPQLTDTAWPMTAERLEQVLDAPARVLVARDGERIVGMVMIAIVHQLKDTKAWIEDIVVSPEYRGQGIAKRLMEAAVEAARAADVRSLNMTSRPQRAAAHGLYEAMGFKQRETLVYRLPLLDNHL
jgi:ribosomal protein S18 acetylase RimI-like enzyme